VTKLVVAPFLEPIENGMEAPLRIALQLPIDRDVARVAYFFGKIGRIENEFGLEESIFLGLGQEA